jgi:hypothetical protein
MSAQQVCVQSVKRKEIVISDGRFVSIYQVKAGHLLNCLDTNPMIQAAKLMTLSIEIDDNRVNLETILNLDLDDFNRILHELTNK